MPDITKPAVVITGAGEGGIGGELVKEFARKGYHVFASARRLETVQNLVADSDNVEALELDVTKVETIKAAYDVVHRKTGGQLAFLVNNAGIGYIMPAIDIDLDEARRVFETNVFGVMAVTQVFAPMLITSTPPGRIVMTGSVSGTMPYTFGSVYNASKAALHGYADTLRHELMPMGVEVITVVTGGVSSLLSRYPRTLPEGSAYTSINDSFQHRVTYSQRPEVSCPASVYAKSVVAQVTKPHPSSWIYKGKFASILWFIKAFAPRWFWDYVFIPQFGLSRLKVEWNKEHGEGQKYFEQHGKTWTGGVQSGGGGGVFGALNYLTVGIRGFMTSSYMSKRDSAQASDKRTA